MSIFRFGFFLFFLIGAACASAAEPPPVSVTFTVVGWGEELRDIGYYSNGKPVKMIIPEEGRSQPYTYTGPEMLTFVRFPPPPSPDAPASPPPPPRTAGDKQPPPLTTVTFDPVVKKHTVLLLKTAAGLEAVAIPADESGFPVGQALLFNLTPMKLAVRCNGKDVILLAPRERRLAPSPAGTGELELDIEIVQERNGRWQRVVRSYLPLLPDDQTLVLFLPGESRRDSIRCLTLRQKPTREEPVAMGARK